MNTPVVLKLNIFYKMHNPFDSNDPVVYGCAMVLAITVGFSIALLFVAFFVYLGLPPVLSLFATLATLCAPRVIYYMLKGK